MMVLEGISYEVISSPAGLENDSASVECRSGDEGKNKLTSQNTIFFKIILGLGFPIT